MTAAPRPTCRVLGCGRPAEKASWPTKDGRPVWKARCKACRVAKRVALLLGRGLALGFLALVYGTVAAGALGLLE